MKKILKSLFALSLTAILFTACGSDDDEPEEKKDSPIESTAEDSEASQFIGDWRAGSGNMIWHFRPDGICSYTDEYNMGGQKGTWSYNVNSKILITNIQKWNFKILAISSDSWTGTYLAGEKETITYSKTPCFGARAAVRGYGYLVDEIKIDVYYKPNKYSNYYAVYNGQKLIVYEGGDGKKYDGYVFTHHVIYNDVTYYFPEYDPVYSN